ncbi:MAG TPA: hypothetical protein VF294_18970 [Polyangiaceae bacterium]
MKLSDVMSAMHMTIYAELPLLIFVGVFIGVALHLLQGPQHFEAMRSLPLDEEDSNEGRER